MSQLWVTRWRKEGKWRVRNAFKISRERVVSPAKWAPRALGKDEHSPASFQRESSDELNHQQLEGQPDGQDLLQEESHIPSSSETWGPAMGREVRRKARTSSTSKDAPGGRAEEQVSPRLRRSAGEPRARAGPPRRCSVWRWGTRPDSAVGTYGFQRVRAQETMWTPGGAPGSDEVGSAPVSPGLCAWCPSYTSYLKSKFQTWFEICTVKKGNLGWKRNNQLP